jgi:hypothetical protein
MNARLNLHVGTLTTRPGVEQAVQRILQELAPPIQAASGGDIELKVFNRGHVPVLGWASQAAVPSEVLHQALEKMTGDQVDEKKVTNIGLLVADRYEPAQSFFGVMFDDAFEASSSNPWKRTPREGCAVFLGGIDDGRSAADRLDETVFTAVHELAHVFNIQHGEWPSYVYQSALRGQVPLNKAAFSQEECKLLALCSRSKHIWPGGSAYEDLGDLVKAKPAGRPVNAPALALRLGMEQRSFFAFEPVELDVELSTTSNMAVRVADAIDPGYSGFRLWIGEPDGSRRFLRSPRHYCSPRGVLKVTQNKPFTRDISVYGESGGYTFRRAGAHQIWATFETAPERVITSNVLEVEVLAGAPDSQFFKDASGLLRARQVAWLLYYRRMSAGRTRALGSLDDFCAAYPRHPASAMVHYGVGRALARALTGRLTRGAPDEEVVRDARRHLRIATRRTQLGDHRQERAEEALSLLGTVT